MPDDDWSQVDEVIRRVLAEHQGVAHIRVFLLAGLSRLQVAAALGRGVLERPRIGWYVDPALPWRGKRAIRIGGIATCVSAAESWGLPVPHGAWSEVHASMERNASRLRHSRDRRLVVRAGGDEWARWHWERRVDPPQGWRTSVVDTLLGLGDCVPEEWFIAAVDAALHRSRTRPPILSDVDFVRLVTLLPRRLRRALKRVDARAESPIETLLRLGLLRRGIGPFDLQVWTHPDHRVDIVVRGRLILEADGEEFHDPVKDAIRDALMRSLGYTVLRFGYEEIVFDLDGVLDRIEGALAALGHSTDQEIPPMLVSSS